MQHRVLSVSIFQCFDDLVKIKVLALLRFERVTFWLIERWDHETFCPPRLKFFMQWNLILAAWERRHAAASCACSNELQLWWPAPTPAPSLLLPLPPRSGARGHGGEWLWQQQLRGHGRDAPRAPAEVQHQEERVCQHPRHAEGNDGLNNLKCFISLLGMNQCIKPFSSTVQFSGIQFG